MSRYRWSEWYNNSVLGTPLREIEEEIIAALKGGPQTRAQLVQTLKRARTTVYDHLVRLIRRKIVYRYPKDRSTRGRPFVLFALVEGSD